MASAVHLSCEPPVFSSREDELRQDGGMGVCNPRGRSAADTTPDRASGGVGRRSSRRRGRGRPLAGSAPRTACMPASSSTPSPSTATPQVLRRDPRVHSPHDGDVDIRGLPAVDCKRASVRWPPSPSGWLAAAAPSSSRFSSSGWPRSPRWWAIGVRRARSRRAAPGCTVPSAPRSPGPLLRHLVHRRRHGLGVRTGGR